MSEQDRREQILSRMVEILAALPGIKKCYRNVLDIAETDRPGWVVNDGDEVAEEMELPTRGRAVSPPLIITMSPEAYLITAGPAATVGTDLNTMRIQAIKAILGDDSLKALAKDGAITYGGMTTELAVGRSMLGAARLQFEVVYVIHPANL